MKKKSMTIKAEKTGLAGKSGMISYPVGDFLIRIKNVCMARGRGVEALATKKIVAVAEILKRMGYLEDFSQKDGVLMAKLAYKNKAPVLMNIKLISKPGRRVYVGVGDIEKKKDPSIPIISTANGILTAKEAIKQRIGGELIAEIL